MASKEPTREEVERSCGFNSWSPEHPAVFQTAIAGQLRNIAVLLWDIRELLNQKTAEKEYADGE